MSENLRFLRHELCEMRLLNGRLLNGRLYSLPGFSEKLYPPIRICSWDVDREVIKKAHAQYFY